MTLHIVRPVEARCPIPNAPEPGEMRNPAPVDDPSGSFFWMKLTTINGSVSPRQVRSQVTYRQQLCHSRRTSQRTRQLRQSTPSKEYCQVLWEVSRILFRWDRVFQDHMDGRRLSSRYQSYSLGQQQHLPAQTWKYRVSHRDFAWNLWLP